MENKQIELFKISKRIYQRYINNVRNAESLDELTVRKKLTRNFLLGTAIWFDEEDNYQKRRYGNLEILVDLEQMKVVDIYNIRSKFKQRKYYIDKIRKEELNKALGI